MIKKVVGKEYRVVEPYCFGDHTFNEGDIVILVEDDGSESPLFKHAEHGHKYFLRCSWLEEIEEPAEYQQYYDHDNQIQALKQTLAKHAAYLAEDKRYSPANGCPLCYANTHIGKKDCSKCAWGQITGKDCTGQPYENSSTRIPEILKWIEIFEEDKKLQPKPPEKPVFKPFNIEVSDYETYLLLYAVFNCGTPKQKEVIALLLKLGVFPAGAKSLDTQNSHPRWNALVTRFKEANPTSKTAYTL